MTIQKILYLVQPVVTVMVIFHLFFYMILLVQLQLMGTLYLKTLALATIQLKLSNLVMVITTIFQPLLISVLILLIKPILNCITSMPVLIIEKILFLILPVGPVMELFHIRSIMKHMAYLL